MENEELLAAIRASNEEHRKRLEAFIHGYFCRLVEKIDRLRADMADPKPRATAVKVQLGHLTTSVGRTNQRIDGVDARLERIERHLDLAEGVAPAGAGDQP
jgi:chromosome segregation ATPase